MTLDLEKFISNSIKMQAKIQHLDVSTKTVKTVPPVVERIIAKEYGDNYLLDADYVSFFWGSINKENIKQLFNVVDKALGKSANKLTDTDFKKIPLELDRDLEQQDNSTTDADNSDDNIDDGGSSSIEDADNAEKQENLDEDGPSSPTKASYFFLKITLK